MKATITREGILILKPESALEEFGLIHWREKAQSLEENVAIKTYVDIDDLIDNLP